MPACFGAREMHDHHLTVQNVSDLTRRAFEALATRIGLSRAEFLQLLLVEYATSKVLNTNSDHLKTATISNPIACAESRKSDLRRIRLKPAKEDQVDTDGPSSEEIADWIRRVDAKKEEKAILHLSNSLFKSWLGINDIATITDHYIAPTEAW